jgi:2,4-dienoyl-CoA reductase-like NADH-dependent reductase (Old Yellow Enzyme family)
MGSFPHLFSPINIGNITLKNRIVFTPHHTKLAMRGIVGQELIRYYERRAEGGVGMIVLGPLPVHPSAVLDEGVARIYDEANVKPFMELTSRVKDKGSKIVAQIWHPGRQMNSYTSGEIV